MQKKSPKIANKGEFLKFCQFLLANDLKKILRNTNNKYSYYKLVFFFCFLCVALVLIFILVLFIIILYYIHFFLFLFLISTTSQFKIKKIQRIIIRDMRSLFLCKKIWRTKKKKNENTHVQKGNIKMCKTQALLKDICNTIKNQVSLPKRLSAKS